jgi:hypothetical protein
MRQTDLRTNNMDRIKFIILYISFGLSFFFLRGQQIGNYVNNGSFEDLRDCNTPQNTNKVKYWSSIDTTKYSFYILNKCFNNMPGPAMDFQYPKSGKGFIAGTFYCGGSCDTIHNRSYFRNKLKQHLVSGKTYCIKFYANLRNSSPYGIDAIGVFIGNNTLDTIKYGDIKITYLTPQIQNISGNIITDTLNWVSITGTFVANGTENSLVIGNFKSDNNTNKTQVLTPASLWSDIYIDDVSCIEQDLSAYSGPDQIILPGDSAFIGRQPDFAIDSDCIWYKLPNMTTSIDTISGLWVKPTTTSTYVVRQQLDCSSLKWDTVVVTINTNLIGIDKLRWFSDNITLFPNPTSGNLNISFPSQVDIKTFNISNSFGQIVREEEIEIKNSSCNILTFDLKSGLYQIHFKTQFGIVTKKFVKTN